MTEGRRPEGCRTSVGARAYIFGSAKTSAVKASSLAPVCQAFGGKPAFLQVCSRKADAVPSVLDRYLRQQQAAMEAETDEQAVASNFHLIGVNGLRRREDAEGYLQVRGLVPSDRREA